MCVESTDEIDGSDVDGVGIRTFVLLDILELDRTTDALPLACPQRISKMVLYLEVNFSENHASRQRASSIAVFRVI